MPIAGRASSASHDQSRTWRRGWRCRRGRGLWGRALRGERLSRVQKGDAKVNDLHTLKGRCILTCRFSTKLKPPIRVLIDMCCSSDGLDSSGWDKTLFGCLLFCYCFEVGIRCVFPTDTVPCNYSIGSYGVLQQLGTLLQIICSAFFTRYPIQKLAFMLKNRVSPHLQLFMRVGMFLNGFIKLFTKVDHNPDEFVGL